jgi:RNA polymerase sigma-70 factor, ECF subfamily
MRANELTGCGNDFLCLWPVAGTERTAARPKETPDYSTLSDKEWIARIQKGDEDAAKALIERLSPLVLKCVRSHRPQRAAEEDMVQAVFAKIFNKLDQFGGDVPLEHWVSRVTINTCLKQIDYERCRPEWRWGDLGVEEQAVLERLVASDDDLADSESASARELVERLLQGLEARDRLVITLVHLEGRTMEEVSAITGWSANAVKVRAYRARRRMRAQIEAWMAAETLRACVRQTIRAGRVRRADETFWAGIEAVTARCPA